jgi:hypothetical protein
MDDDHTLLKTINSKNDLPLATKPDITQPKSVTKRDIQSVNKLSLVPTDPVNLSMMCLRIGKSLL